MHLGFYGRSLNHGEIHSEDAGRFYRGIPTSVLVTKVDVVVRRLHGALVVDD